MLIGGVQVAALRCRAATAVAYLIANQTLLRDLVNKYGPAASRESGSSMNLAKRLADLENLVKHGRAPPKSPPKASPVRKKDDDEEDDEGDEASVALTRKQKQNLRRRERQKAKRVAGKAANLAGGPAVKHTAKAKSPGAAGPPVAKPPKSKKKKTPKKEGDDRDEEAA